MSNHNSSLKGGSSIALKQVSLASGSPAMGVKSLGLDLVNKGEIKNKKRDKSCQYPKGVALCI